jgi:hypothetical protein
LVKAIGVGKPETAGIVVKWTNNKRWEAWNTMVNAGLNAWPQIHICTQVSTMEVGCDFLRTVVTGLGDGEVKYEFPVSGDLEARTSSAHPRNLCLGDGILRLDCGDGFGICACSEQLGLILRSFIEDDGGPAIEVERLY